MYKYFETILVDPAHTVIRKQLVAQDCAQIPIRSLTSSSKKYRGLRGKGHNNNKCMPSIRVTW